MGDHRLIYFCVCDCSPIINLKYTRAKHGLSPTKRLLKYPDLNRIKRSDWCYTTSTLFCRCYSTFTFCPETKL